MADIVNSLFGLSSMDLINQQRQNDASFASNVANIYQNPNARLGALVGANLGGGLARGLFNIQDPQIKAAQDFEMALVEAQQSSSNPAEAMAKLADKLGSDPRFARQAQVARMKAQELQQDTQLNQAKIATEQVKQAKDLQEATIKQQEADRIKSGQDALQGYLTAVDVAGEIPTAEGVFASVGPYMKPEDAVKLIQSSSDKAAYRDAMLQQSLIAAESRRDLAVVMAKSKEERDAAKLAGEKEILQIKKDLGIIGGGGKSSSSGVYERIYGQQFLTSASEVGRAAPNLDLLSNSGDNPLVSGAFSNLSETGVFGATARAFGTTITKEESQQYEALMLPIIVNIATMQNSGRRPTVNQTDILAKALISKPGTTYAAQLQKMAEIPQIASAAEEAMQTNPALTDAQKKLAQTSLDRIKKAIPFSVQDVYEFQKASKSNPNLKFSDFLGEKLTTTSKSKVDMTGLPPASSVKSGTIAKDDSGKPRFRSNGKTWEAIK